MLMMMVIHITFIYIHDPSPPIADLCGFELRKLFIRTIACALEHREHLNRCEEDSDWSHKQSNILCLWNLPASGILFAMKGDYTLRYNCIYYHRCAVSNLWSAIFKFAVIFGIICRPKIYVKCIHYIMLPYQYVSALL